MGQTLPAFADVEEVVYELLSPLGTAVVKGTPPQIVAPLILIKRVGGHSDYVTDYPQILVTTIGATRMASTAMQLQCQMTIENAFCTSVVLADNSEVLIDGTETMTSGHPQIYENVDVREVAAVYQLRMRRPVVAAH